MILDLESILYSSEKKNLKLKFFSKRKERKTYVQD